MIRLRRPDFSQRDALGKVIEGIIQDVGLRQKVENEEAMFHDWSLRYTEHLERAELYNFAANQRVFGQLTAEDIEKLYPGYFARDKKPARDIYDAIKNEASGECPLCGGLGFPENLDHYLPKKQFSQFSVLPLNLVPACRDCNMGAKGQAYAVKADDQAINPYESATHFFDEQWIYARYDPTNTDEPGVLAYYVNPPEHWSESDKARVHFHFDTFELARKYSVKAAQELPFVLRQIQAWIDRNISYDDIKELLFVPVIDSSPFINQWKRCMYQALCDHNFD